MTTITDRELNRATLARQILLGRVDSLIPEAVAFLLGLQAQTTNGPYQALWNRLSGFTHQALTTLIADKTLLRATTMRTTLHLHTVDDMRAIRPLLQPMLDRTFASPAKARTIKADRAAVRTLGVELLNQQPMTAGDLGKRLLEAFPDSDPYVLAQVVQGAETLVQIPPTRIWGHGGPPLLTRIESWIGQGVAKPIDMPALVLRYLKAFGPASVADMQHWCGLTRLAPAFEAVRDQLITFTAEDGRTLYDLPDAPRPDADTPAPPRFLPEYDNVYLGFADRRRIQSDLARARMPLVNGYPSTFTVDGFIAGKWSLARRKDTANLTLTPFRTLLKRELAAVDQEGRAMAGFLTEGAAAITPTVLPVAD
ncbi:winged helix DNA-binding domain-containing protein [Devosia sp.]|uniref:winged helix DNA-binding domain-containing protein n=1 Tax=Devosia sp. TaxID=1871048 RepID=UPI0026148055|nr:winged helix DNA-binding domain-containing protein [Devosia sp.]